VKLGADSGTKKRASLCDLPDLQVWHNSALVVITSIIFLVCTAIWFYAAVILFDDMKWNDNALDKWVQHFEIAMVVLSFISASTGIYGAVSNGRRSLIISASIALIALSSCAIQGTFQTAGYEKIKKQCDYLHEDDPNRNPQWTKLGWNQDQFWAWEELNIASQTVLQVQAYSANTTPAEVRCLGFYDGTGDECDAVVARLWWTRFMCFFSVFVSVVHVWCSYRLSEKLQAERNIKLITFMGVDLVKYLDSYMDLIQFIMAGTGVAFCILYHIATDLKITDIQVASCFDPVVPIPGFGEQGYCPVIAQSDQCAALSDIRYCPLSCRQTPCNIFDEIYTDYNTAAEFLFPGIILLVTVFLVYLNSRDGTAFDKEFSNAIWFISIWGGGTCLYSASYSYCRGDNRDWYQAYVLSEELLPTWYRTVLKTAGVLKYIGFVAFLLNVILSTMYVEALEDGTDEGGKPVEDFIEMPAAGVSMVQVDSRDKETKQ